MISPSSSFAVSFHGIVVWERGTIRPPWWKQAYLAIRHRAIGCGDGCGGGCSKWSEECSVQMGETKGGIKHSRNINKNKPFLYLQEDDFIMTTILRRWTSRSGALKRFCCAQRRSTEDRYPCCDTVPPGRL